MNAIKINALENFMRQMYDDGRHLGVPYETTDMIIVKQLTLFIQGIRGAELHDNCIILLDGIVEVPE